VHLGGRLGVGVAVMRKIMGATLFLIPLLFMFGVTLSQIGWWEFSKLLAMLLVCLLGAFMMVSGIHLSMTKDQ